MKDTRREGVGLLVGFPVWLVATGILLVVYGDTLNQWQAELFGGRYRPKMTAFVAMVLAVVPASLSARVAKWLWGRRMEGR